MCLILFGTHCNFSPPNVSGENDQNHKKGLKNMMKFLHLRTIQLLYLGFAGQGLVMNILTRKLMFIRVVLRKTLKVLQTSHEVGIHMTDCFVLSYNIRENKTNDDHHRLRLSDSQHISCPCEPFARLQQ